MSLELRPCDFQTAVQFVGEHHRHNKPPVGHKFSIAVYDGRVLHGVCMVGRPIGRYLDDGLTLEVNRCCTDGTKNACTMLYGAAQRAAAALGYKRIITYTLESENGSSLRASNWICDGPAGGTHWTGQRYEQTEMVLGEMKVRWRKELSKAVLISIRPKWCELIASLDKTIEVRKTRPKMETPFKCYIYCTNGAPYLNRHNGKLYLEPKDSIGGQGYGLYERLSGKVIGEFVCDRIIDWHYIPDPDESADPGSMAYDVLTADGEKTGLEYDDFEDYGKGAPLYGWHISNLVIYDEPMKLCDFKSYNTLIYFECGYPMPTHGIRRPPQSWMYVEGTDMSEAPKMKPCPFCGGEMEAYIFRSKVNPNYWANEHWFLRDNHDEKCFLSMNELFGYAHFGKAENGKPTKTLLEFVEKWNRRAT